MKRTTVGQHTRPRSSSVEPREGRPEDTRTLSSYFDAFAPAPRWHELPSWPPDVFALTSLVLDHTESYRFAVAPPRHRLWPLRPDWNARVRADARAWRAVGGARMPALPALVDHYWEVLTRHRDTALGEVRSGRAWDLVDALLTLHALADEAGADIVASRGEPGSSFEGRAWRLLQARGSLARLSPTRVRILPKTHFSAHGISIRSLSRYLALSYESVDVRWRAIGANAALDRRGFHLVLAPWPLSVRARDFRPAASNVLGNLDAERYGFFEFTPESSVDGALLGSLLETALARVGSVDAVVLPEAAVRPDELPALERTLEEHGARFLVAGAREAAGDRAFGRNYLHIGMRTDAGWERHEQDKHHRWCLDESQIRQYQLTRALHPKKQWWEAIDVREREQYIVDVGDGVTVAPLICEDLARLDEVADVIRRVGPGLVIAALLDGPPLVSRWPSRYASILADEPGSAVLTLTSLGMVTRSRPPGTRRSRVVAHWSSRSDGRREIELAPRATAVLLSTTVERQTLWTADGRCHRDVPGLALASVEQLHAAPTAR